jgi:hypothetical protein
MPHKNALEAHVAAVNYGNAYAMKLYEDLIAIFKPLVGCKILKADGGLLKSVSKQLPQMPNSHGLQVWRPIYGTQLAWSVKTCESYPSSHHGTNIAMYYETGVNIGQIEGDVLKSLYEPRTSRTDYTVKEVESLRAAYHKAKQVADDARSALSPFGEYDR